MLWPLSQTLGILAFKGSVSKFDTFLIVGCLCFGAMFVAEVTTTMGDILPVIPMLFCVNLLLGLSTSKRILRSEIPQLLFAGVLAGGALLLKATSVFLLPMVVASIIVKSSVTLVKKLITFFGAMVATAVIGYLPWGLQLQTRFGSPFYPLFNELFKSPFFPVSNFADHRFEKRSFFELIALPVSQAVGVSETSEIPFVDVRWLLLFIVATVFIVLFLFKAELLFSASNDRDQVLKTMLLAIGFIVAYFVWGWVSGIQRYAIGLELIAPVLVLAMLVQLSKRVTLKKIVTWVVILSIVLLVSTRPPSFGKAKITAGPLVSDLEISYLAAYDNVIVGTYPLAILAEFNRFTKRGNKTKWLGEPFSPADRNVFRDSLGSGTSAIIHTNERGFDLVALMARLDLASAGSCKRVTSNISLSPDGSDAAVELFICPVKLQN